MKPLKHIFVAAALLAILSGCSANAKTEPAKTSQIDAPSDVNQMEPATRAVVIAYFAALSKNDYQKANELTTGGLHVPDPTVQGQTVQFRELTVTSVQFEGTRTVGGVVTAYLTVRFQAKLDPNKHGAWNDGENTRFAGLAMQDGKWKLTALATSPPNL